MKYVKVVSSQSGATEIYQGEDGSLVQVEYYKSGRTALTPVPTIPDSLTVRYTDGDVWETEPIREPVVLPVQV